MTAYPSTHVDLIYAVSEVNVVQHARFVKVRQLRHVVHSAAGHVRVLCMAALHADNHLTNAGKGKRQYEDC